MSLVIVLVVKPSCLGWIMRSTLLVATTKKKKKFNGWWRDKKGDIELFRKKEEFIKYPLENYIVWEKVEVDN